MQKDVKSRYRPDDSIGPAVGTDAIFVSNTIEAFRASHRGTSSPQVFSRDLCRQLRTIVNRSYQSGARSLGTSRRRPPVGRGRHTTSLTQMLSTKYNGWQGQIRSAALQENPMRQLARKGFRKYFANVIAILTAVRATGGHVLWICPPLSSAIHWDFVQDFLSNITTLWLWVDTCQFDTDAHETWLFATSSRGLLPLASQCNHESHLRMKLRTRFAKLVASFVCRDPRTFFSHFGRTLSLRHLLSLSRPPVFLQTRSPIRHPRCCTWDGEVGPLITRLSHRYLGATVSRCQCLAASRRIKHYSNALAQNPLKRAFLPMSSRQSTGLSLPGT